MRPLQVISAPSTLGLFPRGVERLGTALLDRGLAARLDAVTSTVEAPPYEPLKDPVSGLNNADGLRHYAAALAAEVTAVTDTGRFPLVLGGDCSIVFGPLAALAERGRFGLLFLDGHADFAHPDDEPSGEAASMDLAIATGRARPGFYPIAGRDRLVADDDVVVLGYRVHTDGTDTCRGEFVGDTAITAIDLAELRSIGLAAALQRALEVLTGPGLDGFWVHIDADVLDDAVMPAVDYRNPGGLSWAELTAIVAAALATGRVAGLDLTIFNPNLDPDGAITGDVVDFLVTVFGGATG